jgi:hypothetical protein
MKNCVIKFSNAFNGRRDVSQNNIYMRQLTKYCKEFDLKMPITLGLYLDPEYPFIKRRYYKDVFLPKWLADKGMDNVESKDILKIRNVDIRREIILKLGIDRICYDLKAKLIDSMGDYELLELDLRDGRRRPFLKMQNPSIPELWHVEGVHPCIKTVQDALNYRRYGNEMLDIPTLTWMDWRGNEVTQPLRLSPENIEKIKIKEEYQTSPLFPNLRDWKPTQLT